MWNSLQLRLEQILPLLHVTQKHTLRVRKWNHIILSVALIVSAFRFSAQEYSDPKGWSLQECINYGIAHNIPLRQSALNTQVLKNNSEQSRAAALPNLNGGATHVYNIGKNIDRFTNK